MKNQKRRILLVDGSKVYQQVFQAAFADSDLQLHTCSSGAEALALINNHSIDLICSSFHLKDMEGIALCEQVRKFTQYEYKPFLLLTSQETQEAVKAAFPAGVTDVFQRTEIDQLLAYIKRFPFQNTQIEGKILYVEDEPSQRKLVTAMLQMNGLTVDACSSVEEAWPHFIMQEYDLVLTDIVLGGEISGLHFVNQIRRQPGEKGDIPVLAITAFDDITRRIELFRLGVTDYITKPAINEELFARISTQITKMRLQKKTREKAYDEDFRALIESMPGMIWTARPDGALDYVSQQVTQYFGLPSEKLILNGWRNVVHPDDLAQCEETWSHALASGNPYEFEFRLKHHTGEYRWHIAKALPQRNEDGQIIKWYGNNTDITEQRRTSDVLRVLAETVASPNEDILRVLVRQLAISQGVRYALIARLNAQHPGAVDTVTIWSGDNYLNNFTYELQGAPCNSVIAHGSCFYPHEIRKLFPECRLLAEMEAESYFGVPLHGSDGCILGILALFDDKPMDLFKINKDLLNSLAVRAAYEIERKQTEEKLQMASRVFSEAHDGILIVDAMNTIIDVNPTFCEITGYSHEEAIGQNPKILSSGKHAPEFYSAMWKDLTEQGYWHGEIWNRRKNGELYAELLTISALKNDLGEIINYIGLFSDITQSKKQQQALELMAHYDALTKLPNRVLYADRFTQAIARAKRDESLLAICYLDLDGFKQVNDTLGHEAGDQLLVGVAERIKSSLREEDTVSRLGGDEFVLLMGDIHTLDQCEQALMRIHHTIAQPYLIDGQAVTIAASSGVTIYPLDDADPDTLLRHADQAMYQAKLEGRNRYSLFDAAQDQQVQNQVQQLDMIKDAFSRNEFILYYQPKVDMRSGKVIGAEALIRWQHPERGLLPPSVFLPAVDGSSFDPVLGNWVIEQALQQLEIWRGLGLNLQVSINVSPMHLQQADFFAHLDAALARHPDIASQQLQLEVLESSMMEDLSTISELIINCRDVLGVSIALDDFGTGYSSLTYLRRLPAHTVKIDQSFVRDMIDDPNDYAIVEGVVLLSKAFRREVVAEGVETLEHGLLLLAMGCSHAQGYGIARPMPSNAIPQWVLSYRQHPLWQEFIDSKLSAQETLLRLLQIKVMRWIQRMQECLSQAPEAHPHWPIMDFKKCHGGRWIMEAREKGLFNPEQLDKLDHAHAELNRIGGQLMKLYQDGKIIEAREGLSLLEARKDSVEMLLNQMA